MKRGLNFVLVIGFLLTFLLLPKSQADEKCLPIGANGNPVLKNTDAFTFILKRMQSCPKTVTDLRTAFLGIGLTIQTAIVNHQGFDEVKNSQYSFTDSVYGSTTSLPQNLGLGELFIYYYVQPRPDQVLDYQQIRKTPISAIQVLSFDYGKSAFNFYELVVTPTVTKWVYNGDTFDVAFDTRLLHRSPNPAVFGNRNRCGACHLTGAPILKEFGEPFNNWWRADRPIPFGNRVFSPELRKSLAGVVDASLFAAAVKSSIDLLNSQPRYRAFLRTLSLQEMLRPLFCPVQLNLHSDLNPLVSRPDTIKIPSGFFVDTRLAVADVQAQTAFYLQTLTGFGSEFGNQGRTDADHAWLTPVKSYEDQLAVDLLIREGILNDEFVADVLAVDFTNPVFSYRRCQLLNLIPTAPTSDWMSGFVSNLTQSNLQSASTLLENLTRPEKNKAYHQKLASDFLQQCVVQAQQPQGLQGMVIRLAQARISTRISQISQSPYGQILSPDTRYVFPQLNPNVNRNYYDFNSACQAYSLGPWIQ